jgi:hypothetical protein
MAIKPESELRDVHGIDNNQKTLIKAYMQGAIYSWVKNRKGESFAVRDLVGGENYNWEGTPLFVLWEKQIKLGKKGDDATTDAAKDLGWLTKTVLAEDKRTFMVEKAGMVNSYRWMENES